MQDIEKIKKLGLAVIEIEAQAVSALASKIDDNFVNACGYFLGCQGRIVVIGMGKSGHIANKAAATFASTGSPAFFVHPSEASHGDMGMITTKDVVLVLSNSGETHEILTIIPVIKRLGVPLITLTGNPNSSLANLATINIDVSVQKEACPLGLAPTSSSTASLAMCDALAIALLEARGFTTEDFALSHPGGSLGRKLLLRIEDVMRSGTQIPRITETHTVSYALVEMTKKNLGMTTVLDNNERLLGIYTDGDVRRTIDKNIDIHTTPVKDVMTKSVKTISPHVLAIEAIKIMETYKITVIVVTDENTQKVIGVIHMHDLLRAGVV
ncbi:MAG: D-arabinose 5-phosphate isomerase [Legionellales bacterium]|nr:D-arabinose 5-phosphate isomerase [Legionellales bacterium]